jgi:hypothetical protein
MLVKLKQLNALTSQSTRRINAKQSKDTAVVIGINMNIKKFIGAHSSKFP